MAALGRAMYDGDAFVEASPAGDAPGAGVVCAGGGGRGLRGGRPRRGPVPGGRTAAPPGAGGGRAAPDAGASGRAENVLAYAFIPGTIIGAGDACAPSVGIPGGRGWLPTNRFACISPSIVVSIGFTVGGRWAWKGAPGIAAAPGAPIAAYTPVPRFAILGLDGLCASVDAVAFHGAPPVSFPGAPYIVAMKRGGTDRGGDQRRSRGTRDARRPGAWTARACRG